MVTTVPTFTATIYVGFRVGRTAQPAKRVYSLIDAIEIVQKYVNENPLCATVTATTFIYTGGSESGASIGLINYPRFPSTRAEIKVKAMALANLLRTGLEQMVVSIVFSDATIMLSEESSVAAPAA